MISLVCWIFNNNRNKHLKNRKRFTDIENKLMVTKGHDLVTNHHMRIQKAKHSPSQAFFYPNWQYDPVLASENQKEITEKSFGDTYRRDRQAGSLFCPLAHVPPTWDLDSEAEKCGSPPATIRLRPHAEEGGAANRNLGQIVSLSYYPN